MGHNEEAKAEVYVIDDDEAVLDAVRLLLTSEGLHGRYFSDAEAFLKTLGEAVPPSCVVSDVRLQGMSGLDLQKELNARGLSTPIIMITGHGQIDMAVRAVKAGAYDFLEKPFDSSYLIACIRNAIGYAEQNRAAQKTVEDLGARVSQLSGRQREVMDLAVLGYTNKEIAQQMRISPRTVESYRAWVMEKTGAANLAELVRLAMQLERVERDQNADNSLKL
jgi:two-component system, LuxR family, response regulator FixJ